MTAQANTSDAPTAVLVKTYPKISETFILEELLGLERQGLPLHIFSLQHPTDPVRHAANGELRAPVTYLPQARVSDLGRALRAHAKLMMTRRRHYLRGLLLALRRAEGGRIYAFFQAGYLAHQLTTAGIRHVHAHFASDCAGVAELASKLAGVSYSISAHAKDIYLSSAASLRRKLDSACFTVTCTEYNRRYLASIASPRAVLLRMYHGVDLNRFPGADGRELAPGVPLVLSVGRLRAKKGFTTLIEACRILHESGRPFSCKIVGYGEQHDALAGLIARHGLGKAVQLIGRKTQEEVIALYRRATIFALPCQVASDGDRDGIPNVLLEAMAMGLAVVSTEVSGIPEVIHDQVNGLLVRPGDAQALAAAIARLLDDSSLRTSVGEAGRKTVAGRFRAEDNLQTLRKLLGLASLRVGDRARDRRPVAAARMR